MQLSWPHVILLTIRDLKQRLQLLKLLSRPLPMPGSYQSSAKIHPAVPVPPSQHLPGWGVRHQSPKRPLMAREAHSRWGGHFMRPTPKGMVKDSMEKVTPPSWLTWCWGVAQVWRWDLRPKPFGVRKSSWLFDYFVVNFLDGTFVWCAGGFWMFRHQICLLSREACCSFLEGASIFKEPTARAFHCRSSSKTDT